MAKTSVRGYSYPSALTKYVVADTSYGNDTCDSVIIEVGGVPYWLWIESDTVDEREEHDAPKFMLMRSTAPHPRRYAYENIAEAFTDDMSCGLCEMVMETENPKELVNFIEAYDYLASKGTK